MKRANISAKKKSNILAHYDSSKNARATAGQLSTVVSIIQPAQIRVWKSNTTFLNKNWRKEPSAYSPHLRRANENKQLENSVYDLVDEQRHVELAVFTPAIIGTALSFHLLFKTDDSDELVFLNISMC